MVQQVFVNEPIRMLTRLLSTGEPRPTSFIWRDVTRYVNSVGRQWEERVNGKPIRCILIQGVDGATYEVRWEQSTDLWTLHRAWLPDLAV